MQETPHYLQNLKLSLLERLVIQCQIALNVIKDFFTQKDFFKLFGFGFLLYVLGLFGLLRDNVYFLDDWGRSLGGEDFDNWSRYLATFIYKALNSFVGIVDIAPLPQILAIACLSLTSMIILHSFWNLNATFSQNKQDFDSHATHSLAHSTNNASTDSAIKSNQTSLAQKFLCIAALSPLGLSPYYLENLSFRFDCFGMAFAILLASVPFLFIRHKGIFITTSIIALIAMYSTYQSANSVYILLCLFFAFVAIMTQKSTKQIAIFVSICACSFVLATVIYKTFIVHPLDHGYTNTNTLSFSEVFSFSDNSNNISNGGGSGENNAQHNLKNPNLDKSHLILRDSHLASFLENPPKNPLIFNLMLYFHIVYNDLNETPFFALSVWLVILLLALSLYKRKILGLCYALIFIALSMMLSYGVYLFLQKPFWSVRALNGVGIFVGLISLAVLKLCNENVAQQTPLANYHKIIFKAFKILSCGFIICLNLSCIAYANAYANAFINQNQYIKYRVNLAIQDMLKLYPNAEYKDNFTLLIRGEIEYASATQAIINKHKSLHRIVRKTLDDEYWSVVPFWHINTPYTATKFSQQCDNKQYDIVLANAYHLIAQKDKCVVVVFKALNFNLNQ